MSVAFIAVPSATPFLCVNPFLCPLRLRHHTSVDPARHELQLTVPFNLQNECTVGFDIVHKHAQTVDAPDREAVHRVNDVARDDRNIALRRHLRPRRHKDTR